MFKRSKIVELTERKKEMEDDKDEENQSMGALGRDDALRQVAYFLKQNEGHILMLQFYFDLRLNDGFDSKTTRGRAVANAQKKLFIPLLRALGTDVNVYEKESDESLDTLLEAVEEEIPESFKFPAGFLKSKLLTPDKRTQLKQYFAQSKTNAEVTEAALAMEHLRSVLKKSTGEELRSLLRIEDYVQDVDHVQVFSGFSRVWFDPELLQTQDCPPSECPAWLTAHTRYVRDREYDNVTARDPISVIKLQNLRKAPRSVEETQIANIELNPAAKKALDGFL